MEVDQHRCEPLVAEQTRRILFIEKLKQAQADGKISTKAYREMWKAYHEVYSLCDLAVLDIPLDLNP